MGAGATIVSGLFAGVTILVAVLFGGTLLGVIGALLAIPVAASVQIAIDEHVAYRREVGPSAVT